jgi:predicted DNA-binding transcriptional regulator AlpA
VTAVRTEGSAGRSLPTLAEIRNWPATVSPAMAATAFGISRSYAYELARSGEFPAKVIKVGGKTRVLTASVLAVLGAGETA